MPVRQDIINGGVAQLARAFGSYPKCHRFESSRRYQNSLPKGREFYPWRVGQAVKTPPFHGGNTGSIPVRVTTPFLPYIWRHSSAGRASASHAEGHRFEFCCLHQLLKHRFREFFFFILSVRCFNPNLLPTEDWFGFVVDPDKQTMKEKKRLSQRESLKSCAVIDVQKISLMGRPFT